MDKGLNFIPTPKNVSHTPILEAATKFGRRLKLAYHFRRSKGYVPTKFQNKSNWVPNDKNIPGEILETIDKISEDISNLTIPKHKNNLSKDEMTALKDLKQNPEIVIKPADKGSATVVMDKANYIAEGYRQLLDTKYYQKLDEPIFPETANKINEIFDDLENQKFITSKQKLHLSAPENPRPRQFYMLPKIHKPMHKWPVPGKMPPGRPIISDCDSESYKASDYIDHFLKPLASKHASYIKDTTDFLNKLKEVQIRPETLLITMDVESMYTNIDHQSGLNAIRQAFIDNPDPRRPDDHILELLELSLKTNDFQFNNETFIQTKGTAMGRKYAPSYANIFMAYWEKEAMSKSYLQPSLYYRFLDDIYILWDHGLEQFQNFFNILNDHHHSVSLTARIERDEIDFLDVTTFRAHSSALHTKMFFKPTDTHSLLNKASFHPKHTFSGILKSQIMRFHRICTEKTHFDEACSILFHALRKRGYSARFLRYIKSQTLSELKEGSQSTLRFLGVTDPGINQTAQPCGYGNICKTCPHFYQGNEVTSNSTNQTFKIQHHMTCSTPNVIYLIECKQCSMQYIGQTKRSLRSRFNNHRFDIENNRNSTVAAHFNKGLCILEDCKITPIFKCPKLATDDLTTQKRLEIEQHFIKTFKTYLPYGLNIATTKHHDVPTIQFIAPYTGLATQAMKIAKKYYNKLQESMPHIFQSTFVGAYSRNKNLKDMLVSAKLKTN